MLTLTGMSGGYGQANVVRGVTAQVAGGEVVALLGRNGTGKTTLLRTIFGLADRQGGEIVFDGHAVPPGRPDLLARWGAALMPENRGVFPSLTVAENVRLATRKGFVPAIDPRDLFPLLAERAGQPAGTLSGGQKQQLGVARAILAGRRMVVIDELTQGLQPSVVTEVLAGLAAVAAAGVAVIVVDQHAGLMLGWCHRAVVMEAGRVVLDAPVGPETRRQLDELLMVR
ncbi:branched-chain amino acid transport system ATP-binding protein/urea transport system ATP-binding protein [Nonomuraea polychroma]|uniref:Branched-chain amino acid transport system ATP-binding protein/urea transport system ATP-binding protein n=2 Tax=Nonomuraea polychroma TaxID=46176 RepID=A0A438M1U7_9ACTN|nr:branched-chain amino acid transport system ATP-binding protein/urea transport system ATP-binding protein [Nonomuraea polychroma]